MGPRSRMAGVEDRRIRRKLIKHLVEKRRRGRINQCLEELRCLVLEAMNKQPEQYEKMEKADILEMAVRYLRHARTSSSSSSQLADRPSTSSSSDRPSSAQHFDSGFRACVHEIAAFLDSSNLDEALKKRLLGQLQKKTKPTAASTQSQPAPSSCRTPVGIECTVSVQPLLAPQQHLQMPHPAFSGLMSPYSPGYSPAMCPPSYLHFTPTRSADMLLTPDSTPKARGKREPRRERAASSPPYRPPTPHPPAASPMWRPW